MRHHETYAWLPTFRSSSLALLVAMQAPKNRTPYSLQPELEELNSLVLLSSKTRESRNLVAESYHDPEPQTSRIQRPPLRSRTPVRAKAISVDRSSS